jgi:hypothetical protein
MIKDHKGTERTELAKRSERWWMEVGNVEEIEIQWERSVCAEFT